MGPCGAIAEGPAGRGVAIGGLAEDLTGAVVTLLLLSIVWREGPLFRIAEHLLVGVSAAWWMVVGFWSTLVPNLIARIHPRALHAILPGVPEGPADRWCLVPLLLGILLIARPRGRDLSRWPMAFALGIAAGMCLVRAVRSDLLLQAQSAAQPLVAAARPLDAGDAANRALLLAGTLAVLVRLGSLRGARPRPAASRWSHLRRAFERAGGWVLLASLGAAFGCAVTGRMTVLAGCIEDLARRLAGPL